MKKNSFAKILKYSTVLACILSSTFSFAQTPTTLNNGWYTALTKAESDNPNNYNENVAIFRNDSLYLYSHMIRLENAVRKNAEGMSFSRFYSGRLFKRESDYIVSNVVYNCDGCPVMLNMDIRSNVKYPDFIPESYFIRPGKDTIFINGVAYSAIKENSVSIPTRFDFYDKTLQRENPNEQYELISNALVKFLKFADSIILKPNVLISSQRFKDNALIETLNISKLEVDSKYEFKDFAAISNIASKEPNVFVEIGDIFDNAEFAQITLLCNKIGTDGKTSTIGKKVYIYSKTNEGLTLIKE